MEGCEYRRHSNGLETVISMSGLDECIERLLKKIPSITSIGRQGNIISYTDRRHSNPWGYANAMRRLIEKKCKWNFTLHVVQTKINEDLTTSLKVRVVQYPPIA
jgi:hypothetical protein